MEQGTSEIELDDGFKIVIHFNHTLPWKVTYNDIEITTDEARTLIDQSMEELRKGET